MFIGYPSGQKGTHRVFVSRDVKFQHILPYAIDGNLPLDLSETPLPVPINDPDTMHNTDEANIHQIHDSLIIDSAEFSDHLSKLQQSATPKSILNMSVSST